MIYAGLDEKVIEVFQEIRQESGKDSYFYTEYCLKFMDIDTIDTWTSTLVWFHVKSKFHRNNL